MVWSTVETAELTMHDFSDAERDARAGARGRGGPRHRRRLSHRGAVDPPVRAVEGDYFTILGLPLLPLLAALRVHAPEVFYVKRAFVLGHPITHSRSPLIHGHWLKTYGIDGSYEAIDVAPEDMPAFFERIRAGEFVGGNVTVPLKEIAFALCDIRDPRRARISAPSTR